MKFRVSKACGIVALAAVLAGPLGIARAEARTAAPAPHPAGKAVHTAKHAHGRPATRHAHAIRAAPSSGRDAYPGRQAPCADAERHSGGAGADTGPAADRHRPGTRRRGSRRDRRVGHTWRRPSPWPRRKNCAVRCAKTGRYRVALTRTRDRTVSLAARLSFAGEARRGSADRGPRRRLARPPRARRQRLCQQPQHHPQFAADRGNSHRIATALAAPEPQPAPGSAWLQYSMIEQLADDVRMSGVAGAARAALCPGLAKRSRAFCWKMGFLSNRQDEALLQQPARSTGPGSGDQRRDRRLLRRHSGILHRAPDRHGNRRRVWPLPVKPCDRSERLQRPDSMARMD